MKVWYSKKFDMYVPVGWWSDEDKPDDVVELEVNEEVIVCEGGSDEPYQHAGRWEQGFYDANWMQSMGTKIPWKPGKYRIIIREIRGKKMARLSEEDWNQLDDLLAKHGFGGYYDLLECLKMVLSRMTAGQADSRMIKDLPMIVHLLMNVKIEVKGK